MPASAKNLADLLIQRAAQQPHRVAIGFLPNGQVTDPLTLTYGELDRRARAIAVVLQQGPGCAVGDRVLLAFGPGLDLCTAFWGCLYAGVVAVPVPPLELPLERNLPPLLAVIEDAMPAVALTSCSMESVVSSFQQRCEQLRALPWLMTDATASQGTDGLRRPDLGPSTAAYLQYTSGSTTNPRGVVISHANLLANVMGIGSRFAHETTDVAVCWLPTFHAMGLLHGIVHPISLGFAVYLMSPRACLKHPHRWFRAISHLRATHSGAPNFAFELCVRRIRPEQCEGLDLSSWEVAFLAAEPIHQQTLERFAQAFAPYGFDSAAFTPGYGLSEACTRVSASLRGSPRMLPIRKSALRRNQAAEAPPQSEEGAVEQLVSCGPPLADTTVAIVDPESRLRLPDGAVGEIWIRGPIVSSGYWRRPERTQQTFAGYIQPNGKSQPQETGPAGPSGDARLESEASRSAWSRRQETGPFLRSGDLGFLDEGQLYVTGRYKDIIIIRGKTYYPQELERVAEQAYPSVRPACCAAFGVTVTREERLVIVAEVERRGIGPVVPNRDPRESGEDESPDRRAFELEPGYEPDNPAAFDAQAIEEAIRRAIAARLGLRVHGVALIVPGSIPKTSTGKVRRGACRKAFLEGRLNYADRRRALTAE